MQFTALKKLKLMEFYGKYISLLMRHFPRIEHLTIKAIRVEEFTFDETVKLSNVRKLFFIESMPVEIGAILKKCPILEELHAERSDIIIRDPNFTLPNLKKLSVKGGRIREKASIY